MLWEIIGCLEKSIFLPKNHGVESLCSRKSSQLELVQQCWLPGKHLMRTACSDWVGRAGNGIEALRRRQLDQSPARNSSCRSHSEGNFGDQMVFRSLGTLYRELATHIRPVIKSQGCVKMVRGFSSALCRTTLAQGTLTSGSRDLFKPLGVEQGSTVSA